MDGKELDSYLFQYAKHSEIKQQMSKSVRGIRENDGGEQVQIGWEGLPSHFE